MASLRFLLAMGLLWLPLPPEELPLTIASGLELVRFLGVEGALDTMPGDCFVPLPACCPKAAASCVGAWNWQHPARSFARR
jgi:hypothetical protein